MAKRKPKPKEKAATKAKEKALAKLMAKALMSGGGGDGEDDGPRRCLHPQGSLTIENVRLEWILLRCEACGKILATKETE